MASIKYTGTIIAENDLNEVHSGSSSNLITLGEEGDDENIYTLRCGSNSIRFDRQDLIALQELIVKIPELNN